MTDAFDPFERVFSLRDRIEVMSAPARPEYLGEIVYELFELANREYLEKHGYKRDGAGWSTDTPAVRGREWLGPPAPYLNSVDAAMEYGEDLLKSKIEYSVYTKTNGDKATVYAVAASVGRTMSGVHAHPPMAILMAALYEYYYMYTSKTGVFA